MHFVRNALAHANKVRRRRFSASISTLLAQDSAETAHRQRRSVAERLRAKPPKLGARLHAAEDAVLSSMKCPTAHWLEMLSTNPLERSNAEIKR